jgi:predicted DNA-binding protein (MmcQ/YjbR family)
VSLFDREDFDALIGGLPAAELVYQWGDASVGKVGGKIFAIFSPGADNGMGGISFKCSETSFHMLPELEGVRPAPYLARAKWVLVVRGAELSDKDIAAYTAQAHRLIAEKLPGRIRNEIGLDEIG